MENPWGATRGRAPPLGVRGWGRSYCHAHATVVSGCLPGKLGVQPRS